MLVLSRKVGERILIGDCITVTIVRVAPGVVRLGVDAPQNMTIVREELLDPPDMTSAREELLATQVDQETLVDQAEATKNSD